MIDLCFQKRSAPCGVACGWLLWEAMFAQLCINPLMGRRFKLHPFSTQGNKKKTRKRVMRLFKLLWPMYQTPKSRQIMHADLRSRGRGDRKKWNNERDGWVQSGFSLSLWALLWLIDWLLASQHHFGRCCALPFADQPKFNAHNRAVNNNS